MINVEDDQLTVIRDVADDPSRAAERADEHSNVIKFLDRLPQNQREVIRLKFEGDMSYKEISQTTQLSVSNVGFLIHAGIKRLRGLLSDQVA
ncbi:MAG: sigma-70 family RNA polymerase sigma factor, partial [Verrucomicrobiales bacterium]|nr:sigma-70 family RNA polymerase sigma factor [Verrucomicrobiales bacterium]